MNSVPFPTIALVSQALLVMIVGCSNGQTEPTGSTKLRASVKSTIEDSAVENVFELEAGSLKDSSVTFPPGSLAAGSNISIKKGTAPSSFDIAESTAASSPLVIAVTNDSSALSGAQESMTLAIPISASNLALADPYAQLVALLEDTAGNLFIWRRAKIAVIKGKAIFTSRKFGTYQLVFLGSNQGEDFADTGEAAPKEKADEVEATGDEGESGDDGSVEPPPGDPAEFAKIAFVMGNSCSHSSCHGPDATPKDFAVDQQAFYNIKDTLADRVFNTKDMRPNPGDTYDSGTKSYSSLAIQATQPLTDADKYLLATYLKDIGVELPADAVVPPSGSINPPQSIGP